MPGIQVTDLSILEKVICAHKTTAHKMYIANYTSKISDTSWQKDIPDNSSLGLQLFIPFHKDICWRWAGTVLELAPEPTPPKLPGFPGTFRTPNGFTEKATNLLFCKGELELIRLLIIKLGLHSLLLLAVWAFSWQTPLPFYFPKQHSQSGPAAGWTHAWAELRELLEGTATVRHLGTQRERRECSKEVLFQVLNNASVSKHILIL